MYFPSKSFVIKATSFLLLADYLIGVSSLENNTISTDSHPVIAVLNKELVLTEKEKIALKQLKDSVFDNIPSNLTLLRDDLYFVRFLRAKHWDIDLSKRDFHAFLKYIQDEHINWIRSEDWEDMEHENPFYTDAVDRGGRPIGYMTMERGAWNMRKALIQGRIKRLVRYMQKLVLDMNDKLLEAREKDPNINQIELILDFNGFNLVQHGCPLCLTTFIQLLRLYERWIPGYAKDITLINTPQSIYVLLQATKPVLSPESRAVIKIFNQNKNQWKAYLDERIDPAVLPAFLGGLKNNPE